MANVVKKHSISSEPAQKMVDRAVAKARELGVSENVAILDDGGNLKAISAQTMRNVLKRNSVRFAAVLLLALASFVSAPNAAPAGAPEYHDQQPGFYRLRVGDLEVTALYDGTGIREIVMLRGKPIDQAGTVGIGDGQSLS
jgi:hypothetical protein